MNSTIVEYLTEIKEISEDDFIPNCQKNQRIGRIYQVIIGILQREQMKYQRDRLHHIESNCPDCKKQV